jgi:hypothetical protein
VFLPHSYFFFFWWAEIRRVSPHRDCASRLRNTGWGQAMERCGLNFAPGGWCKIAFGWCKIRQALRGAASVVRNSPHLLLAN